ncbi:MAG: sugar ABC transporter permease [Roseburia sp.]|nr:sugar ABC transporter permease [Roseburia sp.]
MKGKGLTWRLKCIICMLPSLAGTAVFFVMPYFRVLFYSLIDNQFKRNFVGLDNYVKTLKNEYFMLALKNSLLLIAVCVPVLIISALVIAIAMTFAIKKRKVIRTAFILPMVIPTASVALIWQLFFKDTSTVLPIYLLFVWKNIGICIILMTAAFGSIDSNIFEAAKLDGAGFFRLHTGITVPVIAPTILFCVLLSIVNSFKVYKESYLFYRTNYPPEHSYTLQYYMNNHFLKLNYQSLSTGAVLTSLIILAIVLVGLKVQRRYSQ